MSDPNWHPEEDRIVDDESDASTILKYLGYAIAIVGVAYLFAVTATRMGWFR